MKLFQWSKTRLWNGLKTQQVSQIIIENHGSSLCHSFVAQTLWATPATCRATSTYSTLLMYQVACKARWWRLFWWRMVHDDSENYRIIVSWINVFIACLTVERDSSKKFFEFALRYWRMKESFHSLVCNEDGNKIFLEIRSKGEVHFLHLTLTIFHLLFQNVRHSIGLHNVQIIFLQSFDKAAKCWTSPKKDEEKFRSFVYQIHLHITHKVAGCNDMRIRRSQSQIQR